MVVRSFLERVRQNIRGRQARNSRSTRRQASNALVERLESRQLLTVNFNFQYEGAIGSGVGFEDASLGQARRDALEDAASQFGNLFANNASISLSVTSSDDPNSNTLASAGSAIGDASAIFGSTDLVRTKITTGVDLNGTSSDGSVDVNWGQTWEISPDSADVGPNEFDFYSTVYHEFMHVVGFASDISQAGSDLFGNTAGNPGNWAQFDEYITDANLNRVVDAGGVLDGVLWNTESVGGNSANGNGLFFSGPAATAANGGQPVGLYTPTTWSAGSSVSHIDTDNPAYAGFIMLHVGGPGPESRTFTPIEKGILLDLGYTLQDTITINETNGSTVVSDFGQTDTFTVVLGIQPTSDVVLNVTSQDTGEVTVSAPNLTFTPTNWNTPQTVTVSGVSDLTADGGQLTDVIISVDDAASDSIYDNVQDLVVSVTSVDDDGTIPGKPVLTGPGQFPASNKPIFQWTPGANSNRFTLTVINVITGQQVRTVSDVAGTTFSFATPFVDGLYQANVRAFNNLGQSGPVSDPLIFNIGEPVVPVAPSISAPAVGSRITISNPTVVWNAVAGATSYELYFLTAGEVRRVTTAGSDLGNGSLAYTPSQALNEGVNSVWVKGLNFFNQAGPWSKATRFTVDAIAAPSVPRITAPLVSTTSNAFPTFAWTDGGATATTYELWVAQLRAGTGTAQTPAVYDRVIHLTDYNSLSYTHFAPLAEKATRVWVRAFNSAGETGGWSAFEQFTVNIPVPDVPTLTQIANTQDTTPLFSWDPGNVPPGTTYHLWVNNLSTGEARVINTQGIKTTSFTPTVPLQQGRLGAWVQATNPSGEKSAWSPRMVFNLDVLPPSRPVVTGPVAKPNSGSTDVLTEFPTFSWTAAINAVKYELWVNHVDSGTSRIVHEFDVTSTSLTVTEPLPQGNIRAWVRGYNIANEVGEWSAPFTFFLDVPTPAIPTVVAPTSNAVGTVNDATPTIAWEAPAGGATFDLQLEDVFRQTTVLDLTGISVKSYTVLETLGERTYRVRVRSVNTVGEVSDWSAWYEFKIDVPNATTPVALGPTGTVTKTDVNFSWVHSRDSVKYEILVRDLNNGENIIIQVDTFNLDPNGETASYVSNLANGTYRFWVRAFNSQNTASGWSNSLSFIVEERSAALERPQDELQIVLTSLEARPTDHEQAPSETAEAGVFVPDDESRQTSPVEDGVMTADVASDQDALQLVMAEFADPTLAILEE